MIPIILILVLGCKHYLFFQKVELARVLHYIHKIDVSRMAILTPYSAQKEEIKKLAIRAKLMSDDQSRGLKVASITESQGKSLISSVHSTYIIIHYSICLVNSGQPPYFIATCLSVLLTTAQLA